MGTQSFSGTLTFLFTDIEGSTRLLQKNGKDYEKVLAEHHFILRETIKDYGGIEDNAGDGFFILLLRFI